MSWMAWIMGLLVVIMAVLVTGINAAEPVWVSPATGGSTANVNENSPVGTTVYTLQATDSDGDSLTYRLYSNSVPLDDYFEVTGTDVKVKAGATLNAEVTASYTLMFEVTDGTTSVKSGSLTLTVNDVSDETSVIQAISKSMVESQAVDFGIVTPDFSPAFTSGITYALVAANTYLDVDTSTGLIKTTATPLTAAIGLQVIEVTATKGANSATATITITPVASATFVTTSPATVTATSVSAGSTVFEPDFAVGASLSFSITGGNPTGDFDFSTGILKVAAGKTLSKATTASYTLTLDVNGATLTLTVSVDEAPLFTNPAPAGTSTASIAENSPSGTTVATLAASDTEGDSLTYALRFVYPADDFFEISGDKVVLKSGAKLNFEVTPAYDMYFMVQDGTSTVYSNKLTLSVTDVADESSLFSPLTMRLVHKQPADVAVITASFVDAFPTTGTTYAFVPTAPVYFTIDASTGQVKTSSTLLTYATTSLEDVVFEIVATHNSVSSATATVTVYLDTGPEFTASSVNVDVAEGVAAGSTVYNPNIVDADGDTLVYSITTTPSSTAFDFDTATGIVTRGSGTLSFAAVSSYVMEITATDNTDSLSATVTVNIAIKTAPVFVNPNPSVVPTQSVNEGTTGSLYTLSVSDADGDSQTITITAVSPVVAIFEITAGVQLNLKAGSTLDYETQTQYLITFHTEDQTSPTAQTAESQLRIQLTNLNDVTPVFTGSPYSVSIKEGMGPQTNLLQVSSTDADNIATTFIYQVSGAQVSSFGFDGDQLKTLTSLTYDAGTPVITVNIEVVDAASGGNTGQGTIAVTVIQATAPQFVSPTSGDQTFSIPESQASGATILTVSATDADGDTLTYSVTGPGLPGKFNFDAGTRVLSTTSTFDYETVADRLYVLSVVVTDTNGTPLTVSGTVTVSVTDVNDNTPVFGQTLYNKKIVSGITNTDFLTPTATDADGSSPNNAIQYGLAGSPPAGFSIDSSTGALSATSSVVYDAASPVYTLDLTAKDLNGGVGFLVGTATASVTIITEPVMTNPAASTQVSISEDKLPTDTLLTASSTDEDGDTGTYSLVTSTTKFTMSGAELRLITGQSLEFDGVGAVLQYILEIKVTDDDALSATGTVTLQITDANDNPPVFGAITYPATNIIEQVNTAELVATITVTDADSSTDNNNAVSLTVSDPSLFSVTPTSATVFEIKGTNLLFTNAPYSVTVTAKDRNGAAGFLSATTTLTINVRKVPEFTSPPAGSTGATITKAENIAESEAIYTLSVSASSALTYSIHSQTVAGLFKLSPATTLVLESGRTLDYETTTLHVIVFHAVDATSLTGSATLTISVTDQNDNGPIITALTGNPYTVPEKQTTASSIVTIAATDADSATDSNNVIKYTISAGNANSLFSIGETSGIITAVSNLQHQSASIILTVLAQDRSGGAGSRSASTSVTVSIQRVATFTAPLESGGTTITKAEDMTTTDVVYTIAATSDTSVTYSINSQTPPSVYELTGSANNELKLAQGQSFDFEGSTQVYSIVFHAVDQVPHTASATLTVSISDVNEFSPVFTSFPSTVPALEGITTATSILRLTATDADSPLNGNTIQYSLTTGDSSLFAVGASTGIVTAVNLPFSSTSTSYSLVVTAKDRDGGVGSRSATAAFTVNVKTKPVWAAITSPITVQESAAAGSSLTVVSATDGDGDTVQYSIVGQVPASPANIFVFDGTTRNQINVGSLGLDRESSSAVGSVTLTMRASDGEFSATATLMINIADLNDYTPVFGQSTYTVTISETHGIGTSVINVPATDLDPTPAFSSLTYSITGGNTGSLFGFASSGSSQINVVSALNFVSGSNVITLNIEVTDASTGTINTGSATVIITIKTSPTFTTPSAPVDVTKAENIPTSEVIYTILAADEDSDPLTYSFSVSGLSAAQAASLFTLGGTGNREFKLNTGQSLNFEGADWPYAITFIATDSDNNAVNSPVVTLRLTDVNDNTPTFTTNPLQVYVKTSTTSGTTLATLSATDADSSLNNNNVISYTVVDGNAAGKFAVSSSGVLTLAQTVSLTTPNYVLHVRAADGGTPSLSSTATVSITVVTATDPVITSPAIGGVSINVLENLAVGSTVYTIAATDADQDGLHYTIESQTPSVKFELASSVLRLKSALDYEAETSYTLTFGVDDIDGNSANKKISGSLVINVEDLNEYPVFPTYFYEVNIMEWQTSAISVIDLNAVDQDQGAAGTLTYSIIDGNTDNDFSIDSNGLIRTTALGLTRNKQLHYILAVQAVDGGTNKRADSVHVKVNVDKFNNGNHVNCSFFVIVIAVVVRILL